MNDYMQEAINNAMAQSLGHRDAAAMLKAVPEDRRLKCIPCSRQDQINHALALFTGFDSVDEMVDANGMNGTRGLKSKTF